MEVERSIKFSAFIVFECILMEESVIIIFRSIKYFFFKKKRLKKRRRGLKTENVMDELKMMLDCR